MLALFVPLARAATPLHLDNSPCHRLTGHMEAAVDASGAMTLAEAMTTSFRRLPNEISYGFTNAAVWVRFTLERTATDPAEWWLEVDQPLVDDIRLYVPDNDGTYVERMAGEDRPRSIREIDYRNSVFRLHLNEPGMRTFYLRLETRNSMSARLVAWQPASFADRAFAEARIQGAIHGAYALILAFYVAFWRWSREPVHGWYAAYVANMLLAVAFTDGWAQQALPFLPPGVGDAILGVALCMLLVTVTQLFIHLVDLRNVYPRFSRWYADVAKLVAFVGAVPVLVGGFRLAIPPVQLISIVLLILTLGAAAILSYRKHRHARLFLFAFSFFCAGGVIRYLRNLTILSPGFWTDNGYQTGPFVHMIVMSLGIFAGYNRLKHEKAEAEARASVEHTAREEQRGFLSMVSHEFRTPLSVIDATLQNLAKLPADADTLTRYDKIRRASDRLATLMDNYLSTERISSGEYELNIQPVNLAALVRDTANELTAAGPLVRVHAPPSLACRCDPDLLRIAVQNLIDNAHRHSPPDRAVEVDLSLSANRVDVTVTNHGEGVPADELPRVFERFFRGRNTQHRPGTGLGLHLVQTIARRHGGCATVTSQLGHGSQFRITIPASEMAEAPRIGSALGLPAGHVRAPSKD